MRWWTQARPVTAALSVPPDDPYVPVKTHPVGWQTRAYDLWPQVGELHFPSSFVAKQFMRIRWDVYLNDNDDPLDPVDSDRLIDEATGGIGEDEASRRLALNMQIAGEAWYIQLSDDTFTVMAVTDPDLAKTVADARAAGRVVLRIYTPDPLHPDRADASMRAALDAAEELLVLSQLSRAQSRSRIAQAGVLIYPSELDGDGQGNMFKQALARAGETAIQDPSHPAALLPVVVGVPHQYESGFRHVTLDRAYDDRVEVKMDRATIRVAMALDIPPSLLLGTQNESHWHAWLSAEETYTAHFQPLAAQIAELYASVIERLYEWPSGSVRVEPDASVLTSHPSTLRDRLDAYQLGIIGPGPVLEALELSDEDAPTDEELERIVQLRAPLRRASVAENPGPPVTASLDTGPVRDEYLLGLLTATVDATVQQARSRVGAKLRTKLRTTPLAASLDGVANDQAATMLPAGTVAAECDLYQTVHDSVAQFEEWWDTYQPSPVTAPAAAARVASWIAASIGDPLPDTGPLISELVEADDTMINLDTLSAKLVNIDFRMREQLLGAMTAAWTAVQKTIPQDQVGQPVDVLAAAGVPITDTIATAAGTVTDTFRMLDTESWRQIEAAGVPVTDDTTPLTDQAAAYLDQHVTLWLERNLTNPTLAPSRVARQTLIIAGGGQ